jgi:hypothetical protein
MASKKSLMARLDVAAMTLLNRHFPEDEAAKPSKSADQIKAFDSVVKYFGPRTKQHDEFDKGDSPFEQLRSDLHRRPPPRGSRAKQTNGADDSTGTDA